MPARLAQQDDENIHAGRLRGRAGSPNRPPMLAQTALSAKPPYLIDSIT